MTDRTTIQNELKTLESKLPADGAAMPFAVPDGYFEGLADAILARIRASELSAADEIAQLSPLLAGISRTLPYSVPDQYFSDNLEALPAVIGEEPVSSLIGQAGRSMPFELPAGYFENLSVGAPKTEEKREPARVVPMRRWTRWAAAAVVAGVVAISGIAYFGGNGTKTDISVDNPQWVATKLKNVSSKDIDEFVHAADATASSSVNTGGPGGKPNEVKQLLKGVTQNDLDAFLDGVPVEDEELGIN